MSEATPTQEQLPALVAQGLALVELRLSGGVAGSGLYDSVRNQLLWVQAALAAPEPPDPARLDALLLGVYAAREFETSDPELADVLFSVAYLVNRHWPAPTPAAIDPAAIAATTDPATSATTEHTAPAPDLRPLFIKRLRSATKQYALIDAICLVSAGLMVFLSFAAHPWIVGRIFLLAIAVAGLVAFVWLTWLLITGGARRRSLLEMLDQHPERLERIYLVTNRPGYYRSLRETIQAPEAENMPDQPRIWSIMITQKDPTQREVRLGVNLHAVPVRRDEALPLLAWLRAKAPSASGPPERNT